MKSIVLIMCSVETWENCKNETDIAAWFNEGYINSSLRDELVVYNKAIARMY